MFQRSIQIILLCLLATACTRGCDKSSREATPDKSPKSLHLYIWGEYTSPEIFKDFETLTGIHVTESNFASNEELLAKLQAGADGYDLIVPSDYMVAIMSQMELLEPLDKASIPNAKDIEPGLLGKQFDPANKWSLPYSWAITGIVFNKSKLKNPVISYKDLLSREDLKQRVSLLDDVREAMGAALKSNGASLNATDDQHLEAAKATLITAKARIREFSSTPVSLLKSGDLLAAQIYSNEALRLAAQDSNFEFALPIDGFTFAIDNMVIPKNSRHKQEALTLINFLLSPDINQKFAEQLLAAPVVRGVREKLSQTLRQHPAISQFEVIQAKGEMIRDLGPDIAKYDRIWTEVKAASL